MYALKQQYYDVSFDPNVIPLIDNFIEKYETIKIIY